MYNIKILDGRRSESKALFFLVIINEKYQFSGDYFVLGKSATKIPFSVCLKQYIEGAVLGITSLSQTGLGYTFHLHLGHTVRVGLEQTRSWKKIYVSETLYCMYHATT
jgi:hypothetical protein